MAQHTDDRTIAVESVIVPESLVIHHAAADADQSMFILACDDTTLGWLAQAFRTLGRRRAFVIGDGLPVASDGALLITVVPAARGRTPAMAILAPGSYRWSLADDEARRMAGMVAGMAAFPGPCHQYLETGPELPVVVVSKGEYDGRVLRKMREHSA
jgi:hypothetical protein